MYNEIFKLGLKVIYSNIKPLKEPYKITFAITYKCNSRCKTCEIWKKHPKNELRTKEIEKIFQKINPSWVNLTGGEPFLRTDIFDIAKIIKDNCDTYLLNMTTNALLVDTILSNVKKILKLGFPKFIVVVSLDGPKNIHDKLRGIKGNWDKAVQVYEKLWDITKKNKTFQTFFGYTISPYNIGYLEKTLEEVRDIIPSVKMKDFHINFYHESDIYFNNKGDIKINRNYTKALKEKIKNFLKNRRGLNPISFLEVVYLKNIEKYLDSAISPLPCKALSSSCFIDPQGNVYPCTIFNKKLGNLRQANYDLKEIWNSEKSAQVRKLIKENKCPGCWTPCEAYQTILGNLLKI